MCAIVRQRSFKDILHLKSQLTKFGGILAGFDFPIGIPSYYAVKVDITDFLATLLKFGKNDWLQFYNPA